MNTSKPISTISYNTMSYLEYILNNMIDNDVISFWAYIYHKKEENETKDHIHLYIEPSSRVDTSVLRKKFEEIDMDSIDNKPLGVMPFNSSKFKDWYLYSIHDIDYLRSKGLSRVYEYSRDNVVTSDLNYFYEKVNTIDYNYGLTGKILECIRTGGSFESLVYSGVVKVSNFMQSRLMYNMLYRDFYNKQQDYIAGDTRVQFKQTTIPDDIFDDIE